MAAVCSIATLFVLGMVPKAASCQKDLEVFVLGMLHCFDMSSTLVPVGKCCCAALLATSTCDAP
eukprot:1142642-Pelagomonas_calceolata.AAC.6